MLSVLYFYVTPVQVSCPSLYINQDLSAYYYYFFQNINLYPLPCVVEVKYAWNFYTPSKSICLFPYFLSFLELFSISLEGSSYRRNRMLYCILSWLSVLIVVSGVLGFIPFLVSFRFVWFLGHFLYLMYFLSNSLLKMILRNQFPY